MNCHIGKHLFFLKNCHMVLMGHKLLTVDDNRLTHCGKTDPKSRHWRQSHHGKYATLFYPFNLLLNIQINISGYLLKVKVMICMLNK